MARYDILKDFPGSQDGRFCEQFHAGTQAELSDYLADIAVREGWARLAVEKPGPVIDNKAITTIGEKPAPRRSKAG